MSLTDWFLANTGILYFLLMSVLTVVSTVQWYGHFSHWETARIRLFKYPVVVPKVTWKYRANTWYNVFGAVSLLTSLLGAIAFKLGFMGVLAFTLSIGVAMVFSAELWKIGAKKKAILLFTIVLLLCSWITNMALVIYKGYDEQKVAVIKAKTLDSQQDILNGLEKAIQDYSVSISEEVKTELTERKRLDSLEAKGNYVTNGGKMGKKGGRGIVYDKLHAKYESAQQNSKATLDRIAGYNATLKIIKTFTKYLEEAESVYMLKQLYGQVLTKVSSIEEVPYSPPIFDEGASFLSIFWRAFRGNFWTGLFGLWPDLMLFFTLLRLPEQRESKKLEVILTRMRPLKWMVMIISIYLTYDGLVYVSNPILHWTIKIGLPLGWFLAEILGRKYDNIAKIRLSLLIYLACMIGLSTFTSVGSFGGNKVYEAYEYHIARAINGLKYANIEARAKVVEEFGSEISKADSIDSFRYGPIVGNAYYGKSRLSVRQALVKYEPDSLRLDSLQKERSKALEKYDRPIFSARGYDLGSYDEFKEKFQQEIEDRGLDFKLKSRPNRLEIFIQIFTDEPMKATVATIEDLLGFLLHWFTISLLTMAHGARLKFSLLRFVRFER